MVGGSDFDYTYPEPTSRIAVVDCRGREDEYPSGD